MGFPIRLSQVVIGRIAVRLTRYCEFPIVGRTCRSVLDSAVIERGLIVPTLTVEGFGEFEVPAGKRLVLALIEDAGVDQVHACGGVARCTTCRVEVLAGEPPEMTLAEREVLIAKGVSGVRLSCQMLVQSDMTVRCISRLQGSGRPGPGNVPTPEIFPIPEWTSK